MSDDQFSEVTSESWFSRISGAIKGIIFGLILFLISFPILFWNEGRAVERYKTLKEGGGSVISANADSINNDFEGKLVHLSGKAITDEILEDNTFGIKTNSIKLKRNIEMFQWVEKSSSKTEKKLGGGTETVTTYSYEKKWSSELVDSNEFKKQANHSNPASFPFQNKEFISTDVSLGAYKLSKSLINKINKYESFPLKSSYILPEELKKDEPFHINDGIIHIGEQPSSPQIGDTRISFKVITPQEVSIVAKQTGNTFERFHTSNGGSIELLELGVFSSENMFKKAESSNAFTTWMFRGLGFILMVIGLTMLFNPLEVLADILPLLGDIVGAGTSLISFLLSLILSFITISIAWIFYRPILAISLLCIAGGVIFVIKNKLGKVKASN